MIRLLVYGHNQGASLALSPRGEREKKVPAKINMTMHYVMLASASCIFPKAAV